METTEGIVPVREGLERNWSDRSRRQSHFEEEAAR